MSQSRVSTDDTSGGADAGSAHVFRRTEASWVEEATLLASVPTANDRFGEVISLSADATRALIGAQVFVRAGTSWTEEANLAVSRRRAA